MDFNAFFNKIKPHLLIVAIFIVVTFAFLNPMLQGFKLQQGDVATSKAMYQETKDYLDKTGEHALWTNSMFCGMPTYQIAPYTPNSIWGFKVVYNYLLFTFPMPANAVFLYMFGFYLLLLAFGVRHWIAAIGAVAYAFSTFNIIIIAAGHMNQAYALGMAPMVLAAAVYTIRSKKYIFGAALFTGALAIDIRLNHPQITYYFFILFGIYLLGELIYHIMHKQVASYFKAVVPIIIGAVIAVGSCASMLMVTNEYGKETTRGGSELTPKAGQEKSTGLDEGYATDWSYGGMETFTLLIPNAYGGPSGPLVSKDSKAEKENESETDQNVRIASYLDTYWGDVQFIGGPDYYGAIICFLFLLGFFVLDSRDKWWVLAAFALSIFLAMGRNFQSLTDLFFYHFPMYNKFRTVSMIHVIAEIVTPLFAIITLNKILENPMPWNKFRPKFFWAIGITGGICLVFAAVPSLFGDFTKVHPERDTQELFSMLRQNKLSDEQIKSMQPAVMSALTDIRQSLFQKDAFRSLILILLSGAAIYLFYIKKLKKEYAIAVIGVLIFLDLFVINFRYLDKKNFVSKSNSEAEFYPSDADQAILQDPDPYYRVLNLTVSPFNDASTSYFHKSIGGYHGAKLARFQEFRERYLDQFVGSFPQYLQQGMKQNAPPQAVMAEMQRQGFLNVVDMLNGKYLILGKDANAVLRNPYALGNAWFVKKVTIVPNADSELAAIQHLKPTEEAVSDKRFNEGQYANYLTDLHINYDSTAKIKLTEYKPNKLTFTTSAASDQFAVFSDVYYNDNKGWHAFIDGKQVQHVRVNYMLRGMKIPAGQHTIVFSFDPQTYHTGEKISLAFSLVLLGGLIGGIGLEIIQSRKKQAPKAEPEEKVESKK